MPTKARAPLITFDPDKHRYTLDGQFVPSVTQIIKASDPFDAGPWWGMRVGLAAVVRLIQRGELSYAQLMAADADDIILGRLTELEELVKHFRLTVNHVRQERADEGLAVHYAIQQMSERGALPLLSDFDPENRGFIQAFSKWFVERDPEVLWHEQIVASREHRYAGTADIGIVGYDELLEIVDFKTGRRQSKGQPKLEVYDSWHQQGCGYRMGWNELRQWQPPDTPVCTTTGTVLLHESGDYLFEPHVCPDPLWLTTVQRWWELEDYLDERAKTRNKSGKRRKR